MELKDTRITVPKELYDKAMTAVDQGKFPGIRNFSAMCEYALVKLLEHDKH